MKYETVLDKCVIVRDTLLSGTDIVLKSNTENIELVTRCAESAEKQIGNKPVDPVRLSSVGVVLANCPCCGTMIDKSDFFCRKCGQKIRWAD